MKSNEELLKVLDMSEEEQVSWLCGYIYHHKKNADYWHNFLNRHISLADLAFRLREEVTTQIPLVIDDENKWYIAVRKVVNKVLEDSAECSILECLGWLANFGQPIHWIIAALIAMK